MWMKRTFRLTVMMVILTMMNMPMIVLLLLERLPLTTAFIVGGVFRSSSSSSLVPNRRLRLPPPPSLSTSSSTISRSTWTTSSFYMSPQNKNDDNQNDDEDEENLPSHPMSTTSFLSHMMLKVPSVDETVNYWLAKGGKIRASTTVKDNNNKEKKAMTNINDNNDLKEYSPVNGNHPPEKAEELKSAFVELGILSSLTKPRRTTKDVANNNDDDDGLSTKKKEEKPPPPISFALELVSTTKQKKQKAGRNDDDNDHINTTEDKYSIGNAISYIGVSMLLQFQNNLLGAIIGDERPKDQGLEPNGIKVQSSASAPGDLFARIAFRSNNLSTTASFYTNVLGMSVKAEDENLLCLRYDTRKKKNDDVDDDTAESPPMLDIRGVPTTLIFEYESGPIDVGDCFDHLVIVTKASIEDLYSTFVKNEKGQQEDTEDAPKTNVKIFMKPNEMFGNKVMGFLDPNGYKVIIASPL